MVTASALQDALRTYVTRPTSTEVGPFILTLDPGGQPGRNYAIPLPGARPTAAQVRALRDAFLERSLLPRLELVLPSDALDPLLAGGFAIEQRLPLMAAAAVAPPPLPPGVSVSLAVTGADLAAAAEVQDLAYDDTIDPDNPSRLARTVASGGHVALGRLDGAPAGSGLATGPITTATASVSEIAAVGTLAAHRRRGVAAQVSALLAQTVLAQGTTPYLQAEGAPEQRIYARLGFDTVGEMVVLSVRA
jgi:GNAT superfamily N-acetyltransferase